MDNKLSRSAVATLLFAGALALAGCGDDTTSAAPAGSPGVFGSGGGAGGGGGGGGGGVPPPPPPPPPPVAGQASLVLTLANPTTGAMTTSVPATARAIVRDAAGVPVPSTVVTFTTDATLGVLVPVSGTALTDATGTATVGLNAASLTAAGAANLTATSQVLSTAVSGSIGYAVGATAVTMMNFIFGTGGAGQPPLSAFGTTSVSVTVLSNGTPVTSPQTVTFSSPCAGGGKAVLTASVLTGVGGVATASYRDNGCGGTDLVTASVSGLASLSSTLTVTAPTTGSIQFVSATPTSITLKGTGGAGRQESSQVIFKVVDTGGNPIGGKSVTFALSTAVGGITLTNTSAISDAITGQAVVTVNAGTISTAVRVLASTCTAAALPGSACTVAGGVTLTTQSDQLTVTTGIPDQDSFSVAATTLNIEGLDVDGVTTVLTARLSDHFSNPVPDGTAVTFIAEGGQMVQSCITVAGGCSATMTSAEFRPRNGRITVLAYAVGEESFSDIDGDGLADHSLPALNANDEMIDANGVSTDMAEAFVDYNEDGVRNTIAASNAFEPFIDFNSNGVFDGADGQYNGVLCIEPPSGTSTAGTCATSKSIHVRRNFPIVFSGSNPVFQITDVSGVPVNQIALPPCVTGIPFTPSAQTVLFTITDVNGNIMPAGTTVVFSASNGKIVSLPTSFTIGNSVACLAGAGPGGFLCPDPADLTNSRCVTTTPALANGFICPVTSQVSLGSPPLAFGVTVQSDATQTPGPAFTCTNSTTTGALNVTVTTPRGLATSTSIGVTD